jgi:excisionase family DNA binding protein
MIAAERLEPLVYTPAEVARLLRISRQQVYRLAESGGMPSVRYGRSVRIPRWWVDEQVKA